MPKDMSQSGLNLKEMMVKWRVNDSNNWHLIVFYSFCQWFSKCNPWTNCISITWEFMWRVSSQVPPQTLQGLGSATWVLTYKAQSFPFHEEKYLCNGYLRLPPCHCSLFSFYFPAIHFKIKLNLSLSKSGGQSQKSNKKELKPVPLTLGDSELSVVFGNCHRNSLILVWLSGFIHPVNIPRVPTRC